MDESRREQIWIELALEVDKTNAATLPGVIWTHAAASEEPFPPVQEAAPVTLLAPAPAPQPAAGALRRWRRGPNGWAPEPDPAAVCPPDQMDPPIVFLPRAVAMPPMPRRRSGRKWMVAATASVLGLCWGWHYLSHGLNHRTGHGLTAAPSGHSRPAPQVSAAQPVVATIAPPTVAPTEPVPEDRPSERVEDLTLHDQLAQVRLLLAENRPREAQRLILRILPQHRGSPALRVNLGLCAADLEHFQAALGHFKAALGLRRDYPPALIGLARTYRRIGQTDQALDWYKRYLEVYSEGPYAPQAVAMIARLAGAAPTRSAALP